MIHVNNLSFSYRKQQALFQRLEITLPPGNIYGLLGKNGAGKTTLLKLMSGLLFPDTGDVSISGFRPMDRFPEFTREIYLVTEEFHLPGLTIEQYVRLYAPFYPRFNKGLFEEYINELKIPRELKLSAMSYGQKKNFLLSFGLATDCRLLLLDEPTNGLDIPSKSQFRRIVANAIHENRSFIISTHQVRDMENLIDPIIILDQGKIVFFQDFEQITRKLAISRLSELPSDDSLVYYESSLGSYTVVKANSGSDETSMNLEILFNAVVGNTEKITEIFKN
jgi:ABC-2 type transport system ATP-binding protein